MLITRPRVLKCVSFRAFAAVPVGSEPSLVALLDGLRKTGDELRVVDPDHLHVTLAFLGDVPDDATPRLAAALDEAARPLAPFRLRLVTVGAFPSARRPRVVWAGAEDAKPIAELATRTRASLAAAGFAGDEKDFRAHVTLARARREAGHEVVRFLQAHAHDAAADVPVRESVLFKSTLGPRGPTYDALHRAPLQGMSA
jgi:2'-5' RNA ligase